MLVLCEIIVAVSPLTVISTSRRSEYVNPLGRGVITYVSMFEQAMPNVFSALAILFFGVGPFLSTVIAALLSVPYYTYRVDTQERKNLGKRSREKLKSV